MPEIIQPTWLYEKVLDFTGGENRQLVPDRIQGNQVSLARNCIITSEGLLQTRLGKRKLNTDSLGTGKVVSVHEYNQEDGTTYLIVQHGTSLYSAEWDGTTAITSWTEIKTGLTTNSKLRSVVWRDVIILTNGTENPFSYNGTTCTDLAGSPPKSALIALYASRLWFTDITHPNWVRFSGLETYATWDALNIIYVRDGDGDEITALLPVEGGMVIAKQQSIFALYGATSSEFSVSNSSITDGVGVVATDAADPSSRVFISRNGIFSYSLSGVQKFPPTHDNLLANLTPSTVVCAFHHADRRLLVGIGSDTVLNIEQNYGCITSFTSLNIGSICSSTAAGGPHGVIIGDNSNGFVYVLDDTDDDDGTAITTTIKTALRNQGTARSKLYRMFKPDFDALSQFQSTLAISWDVDFRRIVGSTSTVSSPLLSFKWGEHWDEKLWGPVGRFSPEIWLHAVRGDAITFQVQTTNRLKFLGYLTKYREIGSL